MSKSEKSILNDILIGVSALPRTLVYRSNTGMAWVGEKQEVLVGQRVEIAPGMVVLKNGRPIKFGVPGLGDINGITDGHPLQIEAKTKVGRQSEQQIKFQIAWEKAGGIYILARSPEQALEMIREKTLDKIIG